MPWTGRHDPGEPPHQLTEVIRDVGRRHPEGGGGGDVQASADGRFRGRNGTTESLPGTLFAASELAFIHGLTLAPSSDGSFLWARLPQTWAQV